LSGVRAVSSGDKTFRIRRNSILSEDEAEIVADGGENDVDGITPPSDEQCQAVSDGLRLTATVKGHAASGAQS
jgi:hypothetical protein